MRESTDRHDPPSQRSLVAPEVDLSSIGLDIHDRQAQGQAKLSNSVESDGPGRGGVPPPELSVQNSCAWPLYGTGVCRSLNVADQPSIVRVTFAR